MDYIQRAKKFRTKKSLGQNFLIDEKVILTILDIAHINSDDIVVEIGAGIGFVTEQLVKKAKKVFAIEIDKTAIKELEKIPAQNLEIIQQDILKTDIASLANGQKVKIVANIPYYITSPILAHLLGEIDEEENKNRNSIKEIILMVQYEVARRICATNKSKNKEYGSLSILCNFYSDTEFIQKVFARSFYPAPKVDSAIVKISPKTEPKYNAKNKKNLKEIINATFQARRKTLKNALLIHKFIPDEINEAFNILEFTDTIRGEKLSIQDFCNLSNILKK